MFSKFNRFLSGIEWRLSLGAAIWGILFPATSIVLPAWATWATGIFSTYSPFSWVAAGFLGLFVYSVCVALNGFGQGRAVRARYDAKFLAATGGVDPLAKVFEGKRIFLNDFVLPSNPYVDGKTFVDCEIVGPANLFLESDNAINNVQPGTVDAVALSGERQFFNGASLRNCTFRGCKFLRVTLFLSPQEAHLIKELVWLNWITLIPPAPALNGSQAPSLIEDQSAQTTEVPTVEKAR